MKKSTIISMAVILGGGVLLASCSDYLDPNNKSAGSDSDTYFSTEEGVAAARIQAYSSLKAAAENYNLYSDGTDLYIYSRGKTPSEFDRYSLAANNGDVQSFYNSCYGEVRYGSFYAEKAGEGTLGNAEGRFIRDYAYYQLSQQFGGVPYLDHYVSDANRYYPKMSLDTLYTTMEQDLLDIYNNSSLPATDHTGYISKQAVATLLAKFYLAHAWDIDTQLGDAANGTYTVKSTANFQNAAQWAKTAIGGQQLTQSFEQKWLPSNENNDEQVWSILYQREGYPGTDGGHGLQNQYGNYYGEPTAVGQKNVGSVGQMSNKALYLWDEGDDRFDGTFMTKMYNYKDGNWGTTGYFAYYNADASDLANMPYAYRYYPYYTTEAQVRADVAAHPANFTQGDYHNTVVAVILSDPAIQFTFKADGTIANKTTLTYSALAGQVGGGACVKKWDDPTTPQVNQNSKADYRHIVVFDLSDLYLMVAEADLLAGNETEALQYVNAVRARSHASTLSSFGAYEPGYNTTVAFGNVTPLDVILDERARELFGQQLRWVDLRRTKQLVRYNLAFNPEVTSITQMEGPDGQVKWLRPIPQVAIDGNYSLTEADQNPGY